MDESKIGIIILAAGASIRFGKPKQLLKFQEKSLVRRTAENALTFESRTIIVLGANADEIKKEVEDLPLKIVVNKDWQSGLSSSIKSGLKKLLETEPETSIVILLLCDQPLVDKKTISRLIKVQRETQKAIVASEYENTLGVPALFTREIFDELLNLQGDQGARFLIQKYAASKAAKIDAPEAAFDIDTLEDYERILKSKTAARKSPQ